MRLLGTCVFALVLLLPLGAADAAERGAAIRAGELKAKPFLDATNAGTVAANQQLSVLARQGGWVQVEAGGSTGWLRMLNVRMSGTGAAPAKGGVAGASVFRTGSSGKTVATGIKGVDEEDIRNASPNPAEVAALASLAVPANEAVASAKAAGLRETKVDYLDKKGGK
jgi:hypothetical protein